VSPYRLHDTHRDYLRDHRRRTKADERQRDARDGHDSYAHAHFLQDLKRPHGNAADEDQLRERGIHLHGQHNRREDHPGKETEHDDGTNETELLGKERKDEVRLGLGQKAIAGLGGVSKSLAEDATRTDGDLGLLEVVPVTRWVNRWVNENYESVELVLLEKVRKAVNHRRRHDKGRPDDDERNGHEHPVSLRAGADDDRGTDREDDETGSEVGEDEDETERETERGAYPDVVSQAADLAVELGSNRGHEEDGHELGELRRLKRLMDEWDLHPSGHALGGVTESRHLRKEHEHAVYDEEGRRHVRQRPIVIAPDDSRGDDADCDADEVLREVCLADGE